MDSHTIENNLRGAAKQLKGISVKEISYRIEDLKDKIDGGYNTDDEMEEYNLLLEEKNILISSGVGEQIDEIMVVIDSLITRQMVDRFAKLNLSQEEL